jgi:hypothetical protein
MALDALFDDPRQQGLLALGLGLLNSRGTFGQGLGQAGQQAMGVMQEARQRQRLASMQDIQQQMAQMQLQNAQREAAKQTQLEALRGQFTRTPAQQALAGGGGPTAANAEKLQTTQPGFDYAGYADALGSIDPAAAITMRAALEKDNTPIALGKGGALVTRAGKVLASNPDAPELPSAVREYEYAKGQGYKGTFQQFQVEQKRAGANVSNLTVNTGQRGFDNTLKLRGDFRSEPIYKAHQEVQSAYSQIQQALKAGTPIGDTAAATKVMKLLDPGSVVRESELGMAMAATGLGDRLQNYAKNIVSGNKLTPKQRTEFQQLADALFAESAKQYNGKRGEYQGIAQRNGLNVPDVVGADVQIPGTQPAGKAVKRTGMYQGRKVVEYTDGTVDYAD